MFLCEVDYQPIVDTLVRLDDQLNKPSYRFLKGEILALALEKLTDGRLHYVDEEGYDSIDILTGNKYELKSTFSMFSKDGHINGRVSLCNTNKMNFKKTFDFLLCIQTNPSKFAIAQLTWEECSKNITMINGQINLNKRVPINNWITKDNTMYNSLPRIEIDIRKMLKNLL